MQDDWGLYKKGKFGDIHTHPFTGRTPYEGEGGDLGPGSGMWLLKAKEC